MGLTVLSFSVYGNTLKSFRTSYWLQRSVLINLLSQKLVQIMFSFNLQSLLTQVVFTLLNLRQVSNLS